MSAPENCRVAALQALGLSPGERPMLLIVYEDGHSVEWDEQIAQAIVDATERARP